MFFSTWILTKKGPLAKVWLAAHWEKKLTKNEVQLVDLKETVVRIIDPQVPISCRTQGELLLGCTRIYANKVSILLKESSEAVGFISLAPQGTSNNVDLPQKVPPPPVIPPGIDDLVQLPELASLEITDVIGDISGGLGMILKGADDFIPDDWFQQNEEAAIQRSQLPEDFDFASPSKTSSRPSINTGVDKISEVDELVQIPGGVNQFDIIPQVPMSSPDLKAPEVDGYTTTPHTKPEEEDKKKKKPEEESVLVDKDTTLDFKYVKTLLKSSSKLVRQFVPIPPTEEALSCKQDGKLNPMELIVMCEPMRKRKLDLAFGDNAYTVGKMPEVVGEGEMGDEEVEAHRQGVFEAIVGKSLQKAAEKAESASSKWIDKTPQPPSTVTNGHGIDDFLPDLDIISMEGKKPREEVDEVMYEPAVDPTVSARETFSELREIMKNSKPIAFTKLAPASSSRATAATRFMDLLVLSSKSHVSLEQAKPYSEIKISKGERFEASLEVGAPSVPRTPVSSSKRSKKSKS
eukprot:TRINITY_DN9076_c0_g1_i2.p1 TRINITY_DN9076_c0_g1~~TRINITY_DN9076_c0_g1_i2.p1  ORF type:complete len:519 (+),score=169.61 TRINITY_DN9076_c0_g1_i2:43-1599(+)